MGSSVATCCDALNSGTLSVPAGFVCIYSARKQSYWILWREDKEAEAKIAANIPAAVSEGQWSTQNYYQIGPLGNEHVFHGKAEMLDYQVYNSVSTAVDALNKNAIQ